MLVSDRTLDVKVSASRVLILVLVDVGLGLPVPGTFLLVWPLMS